MDFAIGFDMRIRVNADPHRVISNVQVPVIHLNATACK